ncbi:MAG: hypothetical protein MUP45_04590 [Candidatus Marinimicrobia bacterium]|nr:hypothetical protein [Candidatus Neomarinimicrobiota bacterium]
MATKENSFKQPTKQETLAIKQEERIRRLHHLGNRLSEFAPQWWVGVGESLGLATIFLINFWLLFPFFGHEDKYNAFSAPVIPALVTLIEKWVPFACGVRIWLLFFLIFFPLSFYYFVKEISERKLTALLASFLVILPIGVFLRSRVELGLLGEDGAHIASLTMMPLVCLLLLRFLRKGYFWSGILAAIGTVFVALTSPLGLMVLGVFMGVITFSEMLLGEGRLKFLRLLVVLFLVAGFSAFWYHPHFVLLTLQSSQGLLIKKTLFSLLPISFFVLPVLGVFGFLLFENQPQLQSMFIAFFLTIGFGLFSLGAGISQPLPSRFLPAFGISLAFLLGVVTVGLADFLRTSTKLKRVGLLPVKRRFFSSLLIGFVFVTIILLILFSFRSFLQLEQSQVLGLTSEKKIGLWEIREQTDPFENILGGVITGITAVSVFILKLRLGN